MTVRIGREWTEIVAVAAVSFLLYQLNVFLLVLVPVQLLYLRHGERVLARGASLVFAGIALSAVIRSRLVDDASVRGAFLILELAVPVALFGTLVAVGASWPIRITMRRYMKLAVVTGILGVVSIPALTFWNRSGALDQLFYEQLEALRSQFEQVSSVDSPGLYGITDLLADPRMLAGIAVEMLLRSFLCSYVVLLSGSIWIADFAASKTLGIVHSRVSDFRLPDRAVWVLLPAWALVLLDTVIGIGLLRYVAWNTALVMLFAYCVQGVGIIRYWLLSRGVSTPVRLALGIGVVLLLFWPGVNVLVLVLVPGLGVSETWIHYRKPVKEE